MTITHFSRGRILSMGDFQCDLPRGWGYRNEDSKIWADEARQVPDNWLLCRVFCRCPDTCWCKVTSWSLIFLLKKAPVRIMEITDWFSLWVQILSKDLCFVQWVSSILLNDSMQRHIRYEKVQGCVQINLYHVYYTLTSFAYNLIKGYT